MAILWALVPHNVRSAPCADLLPPTLPVHGLQREITPDDLIRLRDIGQIWTFDAAAPILSLSPDGSRVAFQLRQGDADTNSYCLGMAVVDLKAQAHARLIDVGGDYIRINQNIRGLTNYPSGYTEIVTPKWSPDGRYLAYRRKDDGIVQLWLADLHGGNARPITKFEFDVEDFDWSSDGTHISARGRPGLEEALNDLTREGLSGYLFDDRFIPFAGKAPFPRATVPTEVFYVNIKSGAVEKPPGTPVISSEPVPLPKDAGFMRMRPGGLIAWTRLSDPANVASSNILLIRQVDGSDITCPDVTCKNVRAIWWTDAGSVVFQRVEGWGNSQTGIYEWTPSTRAVRRVHASDDVLIGCQISVRTLICGHESSLQPREIVSINLDTGAMATLFDPNPEFRHIRLGTAQRLHWKNDRGIETFGDLILPPDHKAGQVHPLIVVQYESRGFLRGGTDDEYPVQWFAANRFAVLSFETPKSISEGAGASSWEEIARRDRIDWADRRSTLSALERGVALTIAKGVVDPKRVGITGLSDGSSTVRFALVNSHMFSAAAISSCCEDTTSLMSLYGAGARAYMHRLGYPLLTEDGTKFWSAYSLRQNASRLRTPLLMQLADNEYLTALESYVALTEQKAPVEMYVFPDEYHQKWQPAHRRAVYTRGLEWFDFWLNGHEDASPEKAEQYMRWRDLRARIPSSSTAPGS